MPTIEQQQGRERRKHPSEMLTDMLNRQSRDTNQAVRGEGIEGDLLLSDASLDPNGYSGLYSEAVLKKDAETVYTYERKFSMVDIPSVRAFYTEKHGTKTEEEHIAAWRKNQSEAKNTQMEAAVTALLSEKLGKDFLVVRTARYDDYINGVDNLILDRKTGEVVGAFDEVHEGGDGERTQTKKEKVEDVAKKGGANIKYGLKLSGRKLVRASLEGVPVFYLGLSTPELEELVQGLTDRDAAKTDKAFNTLLTSLIEQHAELEDMPNSKVFSARLAAFSKSLGRLLNAVSRKAA